MKQTRYESGLEQLRQIDGEGEENVIRSLEDAAPDIRLWYIEKTERRMAEDGYWIHIEKGY
ncbi:MAG: hypothetical protein K2K74_08835 [Lachnospiraceae bacterium]|nr:hypothetical protein [Lachnospiraceae bacterium]